MLTEAKVIVRGSRSQEKLEEGMRRDSSPRKVQEMDPAGIRKGCLELQDPGNDRPKVEVTKNPSSQAKRVRYEARQ